MKPYIFRSRLWSFTFFFLVAVTLSAQVWNREVIDSTGLFMGRYCSMELDNEDNPHVVYMDGDFYDLKYSVRNDGQWHTSVLDELRFTGVSCDIALDENNKAHICFQEGCELWTLCPGSGLKYMVQTSTGWYKETVDSFWVMTADQDQTNCTIKLTNSGIPVIAYKDHAKVKLAIKSGTVWQITECPFNEHIVTNLNMVLTSSGDPLIQYFDNNTLVLAKYNVQLETWEQRTYDVGFLMGLYVFGRLDVMDIDANDNIHMIYPSMSMTTGLAVYNYLKYDWNTWSREDYYDGFGPLKVFGNDPFFLDIGGTGSFTLFERKNDQWEASLIDDDASVAYAAMEKGSDGNFRVVAYTSHRELSDNKRSLYYYSFQPGASTFNLSQNSLYFGDVWQQSYLDKSIYISNSGVAPLVISIGDWEEEDNHFSVQNTQKTTYVQPGDSMLLNIRFSPSGLGVFSDKLTLVTNDKNHQIVKLHVDGSGIATGSAGTLNLRINDVILDTLNLLLNQHTALADVDVSVFKNSIEVLSGLKSDENGMVRCELPSLGAFEIKVETTLQLDNGEQVQIINREYMETGPGANSHLMHCPLSLYELKYELMDTLMHIEEASDYYGLDYYGYKIEDNIIENKFIEYAHDFDPARTEAIARFMLVELMTRDLYGDGRMASEEMFTDFGDLMSFIIYMNDWSLDIIDILKSMVEMVFSEAGGGAMAAKEMMNKLLEILQKELVKRAILLALDTSIDQIGSQLGETPHAWLDYAWQDLRKNYSSTGHFEFSTIGWEETSDMVKEFLKDPFVQFVYIQILTEPSLEDGFNFMEENRFSGTFENAYRRQITCISEQKSLVEQNISIAKDLRTNANLWLITAQILDYIKAFVPDEFSSIVSFVDNVTGVMGLSAYVEVVLALGYSTSTFFLMPANMDDDVEDIFDVEDVFKNAHLETGFVNMDNLNQKRIEFKNKLLLSEQAYDSVLLIIQNKMNAGERFEAVLELESLIEKEKAYKNQMRLLGGPVYALAYDATNDIDGFSESYETLLIEKANAEQERYVTHLRTFCLIADSMGLLNDTINAQLQRTMHANHQYTERIMELNAVIENNYNIPAIVLSSYRDQNKNDLALGDTGIVWLRFQNVGSKKTDQLYIKIDNNDALLNLGLDSMQIGELAPGEESQDIELKFLLKSNGFHQGLWTVGVKSDSAFTLSDKGYFEVIGNTVQIEEIDLEKSVIQCFPNPVDASARIEYNLEKATNVSLDLYDLLGRRVKTLFHGMKPGGHHQMVWEPDNLPKGMYLLNLNEGKELKASLKIIVQ